MLFSLLVTRCLTHHCGPFGSASLLCHLGLRPLKTTAYIPVRSESVLGLGLLCFEVASHCVAQA